MPPIKTKPKTTAKPLTPEEREVVVAEQRKQEAAEIRVTERKPPKREKTHIPDPLPGRLDQGVDPFTCMTRKRRATEMYLMGYNQQEIAAEMGVDQTTVSRCLSEVKKEWKQDSLRDMDEKMQQEIATIEHNKKLAIEAYIRSCGVELTETEQTRIRDTPDGSLTETLTKIVKTQKVGDPRFLAEIRSCIELKAKLTGMLKEEKKTVVQVIQINWDDEETDAGAEDVEAQISSLEGLPTLEEVKDETKSG